MRESNNCFYDFGAFRMDTTKRQLTREGEVLPLTSKAFSTLLMLVENQGQTISKEELMNTVWMDTAVEENNLTQQISTLRKALGEKTRSPQFIITIPGQGYSFIAPVTENMHFDAEAALPETEFSHNSDFPAPDLKESPNDSLDSHGFSEYFRRYRLAFLCGLVSAMALLVLFFYSGSLGSKRPAICVLPFRALNNEEKSSVYSEGIPSYVTAKIGNLPNVIVRPAPITTTAAVQSTEFSAKYFGQEQNVLDVGRDSNVDAVLTGSTISDGENVQVIVHLWDVKNNRQIWAKVYTQTSADALNVQEKISEEIISVLNRELLN